MAPPLFKNLFNKFRSLLNFKGHREIQLNRNISAHVIDSIVACWIVWIKLEIFQTA